jgi:acetylornithine deacetylase/succinyl-diaminopimelate desuccinylase-like protein
MKLLHGADERVPIEALRFGTEAIHRLLGRC